MSMRSVMVFAFFLVFALAAGGTARGAVHPARMDSELALVSHDRSQPAQADPASLRLVEEDVDDEGENDNDEGEESRRSQLVMPSAAPPSATLLADDDGDDDDQGEDEDEDERVTTPGPIAA